MHLQSEIPDFYTRYLATVEADLGVLVTFSVRKDKYEEYSPDIESMVGSLKVFRKPGALNQDGAPVMGAGSAASETPDPGLLFPETKTSGKKSGSKNVDSMAEGLLVVIGILAAVGYILWRRKKS